MQFSLARPRACALLVAVAMVVSFLPRAAIAHATTSGWLRPVDGQVVRPFEEPTSVYGPGHRGVDFAAVPGTPVRAANDGVVSFAGSVAGTLHVTISHSGRLRTSYSFLSSISVHAGASVHRGDVVGLTGGSGPDHDGSVLHFGLRVGDRYVDPMVLFRPTDLTKLVRLVPADEPSETLWSPAAERRELQDSLHLPAPGGVVASSGDDDRCGSDVPLVGDAIDAVCDVGGWLGDRAGDALDAGLTYLDAVTDVAKSVIDGLRAPLHDAIAAMRHAEAAAASAIARTPLGQLALDLVEIGRRFVHTVTAKCSDDAPPANGRGGSFHRVMVVAGINSSGLAGDRGPTVALDVKALGYHADENEVRYFSYAADGGPYHARQTHQPLERSAALLAEQLRAMQREEPGREVDLIAHSQGGIVVDYFLSQLYHPGDPTLPPLGNVVTLSSPHEGAPLATAGDELRHTPLGRKALDAVGNTFSSIPPPNSPAVQELSEHSPLIEHMWDRGVPDHIDFTTIGATEDVVVPANHISVPGAQDTTVAVNAPSEHSAIVRSPDALRAVRAALEGRAPPCVSLATALRSAVAPVVISRVSHDFGDSAAALLGGIG